MKPYQWIIFFGETRQVLAEQRIKQHFFRRAVQSSYRGRPIPTNDLWIAASAMQHGLALATYDDHFSSVSGLLLVEKTARIGG